jgi:hypothetical protein
VEGHIPTLTQTLESAAQAYIQTLPGFPDAQHTLREKVLVEVENAKRLLPETLRQLSSLAETAGLAIASVKVRSVKQSEAGWSAQLEVMGHPVERKHETGH